MEGKVELFFFIFGQKILSIKKKMKFCYNIITDESVVNKNYCIWFTLVLIYSFDKIKIFLKRKIYLFFREKNKTTLVYTFPVSLAKDVYMYAIPL